MVNGRIISFMARASSFFRMDLITWAPSCRESPMVKDVTATTMDVFMRGKSRTMRQTEWESIMTRIKGMSTMANGKMMSRMARARKSFKMGRIMKGSSFMESSLALGIMSAILVFMKVSSQMGTFMTMAYLPTLTIDSTMESGKMDLLKGLEFSHGRMETGMKASTSMVSSMVKECSSLRMARYSREDGRMGRNMGRVNLNWGIRS